MCSLSKCATLATRYGAYCALHVWQHVARRLRTAPRRRASQLTMPTWQGCDTRPHVGTRGNVHLASNSSLAKKTMSQSASHCIVLHFVFLSRHVARRWPTRASSLTIATTLPHWQERNTLAHGGGRCGCQSGRRIGTPATGPPLLGPREQKRY